MSPERWQQVKELFDAAISRASEERAQFLRQACQDDESLHREVAALLDSADDNKSFLETPAFEVVAQLIAQDKTSLVNQTVGSYKILSLIGAGGMGEVYLARDEKLNRHVALKVLASAASANRQASQRLVREARAAANLDHPNICAIHEVGEADGRAFIVMQYIEGETLDCKIKERTLSPSDKLKIAVQIADALAEAHEAHIIHRDIKPANIIITEKGHAKVLDFGLAKFVAPEVDAEANTASLLSVPGMIVGTAAYMSPEQVRGEKLDPRTDIFSFGVVLYEMIGGARVFARNSLAEIISAVLHDEPPSLSAYASASPELESIVKKCLAKDRTERYQTMREVEADLTRLVQRQSAATSAASSVDSYAQTRLINERVAASSNNARRMVLASLCLLLLAGIAFALYRWAATNQAITSIAVMPFVNASGNADVEYLSDGMTDTLISSLSQLPKLNIKARNSVFRYKGKDADAKTIGRELNVQAILTGRVVERGGALTLHIELVDVRTENALWTADYIKPLSNLIALQGEIARDVAGKLKIKLSGADEQKLAKNYTANVEANQLYLKGRFHVFKLTPPEVNEGISYFQRAIQLDPNYALAYVGLADANRSLALGSEMTPTEFLPKAKVAANKAIEIDDALSDGHTALGATIFWYDWDWNAAENQFKRALELNSNSTDALCFTRIYFQTRGGTPKLSPK